MTTTLPTTTLNGSESASPLGAAWAIIRSFATSNLRLPQVEEKLRDLLGSAYNGALWKPAFDIVFTIEGDKDIRRALKELTKLEASSIIQLPATTSPQSIDQSAPSVPAAPITPSLAYSRQVEQLEKDLIDSIQDLKRRKRIRGEPVTLEEFLNPEDERKIGEGEYEFPGGDDEIVEQAKRMVEERVTGVTAMDVDEDEDGEPEVEVQVTGQEGMALCERLEKMCLSQADAHGVDVLELQKQLRKMRAHFRKLDFHASKQASLDSFFGPSSSRSAMT